MSSKIHRLDCSGQLCPVPILMTEERIAGLEPEELLEVTYTDPGAKPDLEAWCEVNGHRIIKFEEDKRKGIVIIQKESRV